MSEQVIPLKGGPELLALLDQLPERLAKNLLRRTISVGGRIVRDEARLLAPKGTGLLARSIRLGSPKYDAATALVSVRIKIGGDKGDKGQHQFLATIWEYGSAAYSGQSWRRDGRNRKRSVKVKFDGKTFFGRYPDVAGHRARPFMRPAMDTKAGEAINAMGRFLSEYLTWGEVRSPGLAVADVEGDD